MRLEVFWGRLRRAYLRIFRTGYVQRMLEKRQGECPNCPHDIIDSRDLKYVRNVCGFWFRREDDAFLWRDRLGLARYGLAELFLFSLLFSFVGGFFFYPALHVHWAFWIGVGVVGLLWLEIIYFFRDPHRVIPNDPDVLVSPADGTITNVEEVSDADFPGGVAFRISIFLSIFNVHINRIPRSGRVVDLRYFPGEFLDARNAASAVRNEQLWIDLEEPNGRRLRVKQISGAIARRIVCKLRLGEEVQIGEKLGMIKLGSRTDILLPVEAGTEILVRPGEKVRGGTTMLLRFRETPSPPSAPATEGSAPPLGPG